MGRNHRIPIPLFLRDLGIENLPSPQLLHLDIVGSQGNGWIEQHSPEQRPEPLGQPERPRLFIAKTQTDVSYIVPLAVGLESSRLKIYLQKVLDFLLQQSVQQITGIVLRQKIKQLVRLAMPKWLLGIFEGFT